MAMLKVLFGKWYLLFVLACVVPGGHSFYWSFRPTVTFTVNTFQESFVGRYADYSSYQVSVFDAQLVLTTEKDFGCSSKSIRTSNATLPSSADRTSFVIMMPLSYPHCPDYQKASSAQALGAAAVVFYYNSDSKDGLHSRSTKKLKIPVSAIEVSDDTLGNILQQLQLKNGSSVAINGKYYQSLETTQTFYFVVFSFCILTFLSCMWFILSYVKKCHSASQRRRRQAEVQSETRRLMNSLPLKAHKSKQGVEEPTCAICLDLFHNKDTIRVLPCNHEFHKQCIDPWIKLKRTCPMCKVDISRPAVADTHSNPRDASETRALVQTRSPSVSTSDSSLQLLLANSSESDTTASNESISATNPIVVAFLEDQEENNSQAHTVVVFDTVVEDTQQRDTTCSVEFAELVDSDMQV